MFSVPKTVQYGFILLSPTGDNNRNPYCPYSIDAPTPTQVTSLESMLP